MESVRLTEYLEFLCVCVSVYLVMNQEVEPCEYRNIHCGYITPLGVERERMVIKKNLAAQ